MRTNNPLNTLAYTQLTPFQALTPAPYAVFATTASNLSGTVSAAQISRTVASANLSGTYGNAVTLNNAGNSFSGSFFGNGANVTSLNANNLSSGTVPLARLNGITSNQLDAATWQLATNLNGGNAALASNVVSGISITNAFITNSVFAGNGGGLTNLNASGITGIISVASLPVTVVTNDTPSVTIGGTNVVAPLTVPPKVPAAAIGSVGTGSDPESVAVAGRYAYVVNASANTLQVFDVSTPSVPLHVGSVAMGIEPSSVAVVGRYAYIVNFGAGTLQVFDLGGAYIQQFEAGAMETGTLQTRDTVTVGNNLDVRGGLTVSASARISGGLSVNNGTITATNFSGNGSGLTSLNAAQLSGSVPSGVSVPAADLTGSLPAISGASLTSLPAGNLTGTLPAISGANLTSLNASQLASGTVPSARFSGTYSSAVTLNNTGNSFIGTMQVGGSGTAFTLVQAGQTLMPAGGSALVETNFTVTFPQAFSSTPKVIASLSGDPNFATASDTFVMSIRALTTTTGFTVNVLRVDTASGWSQQLRINWQAWQ